MRSATKECPAEHKQDKVDADRLADFITNFVDRASDGGWDCVLATAPSIILAVSSEKEMRGTLMDAFEESRRLAETGNQIDSAHLIAWNELVAAVRRSEC